MSTDLGSFPSNSAPTIPATAFSEQEAQHLTLSPISLLNSVDGERILSFICFLEFLPIDLILLSTATQNGINSFAA